VRITIQTEHTTVTGELSDDADLPTVARMLQGLLIAQTYHYQNVNAVIKPDSEE
jgi:hypothetical protein